MREGCTSATRGYSTSAQEIPESRNVYLCCRHWCSVLITVPWAGDQDMTHVLSLPSDMKVRKQNPSLGIKLWKEGLRGHFLPPVLILSTPPAEHPNLLSSGWKKDSADQGVSTTILFFGHGAKFWVFSENLLVLRHLCCSHQSAIVWFSSWFPSQAIPR